MDVLRPGHGWAELGAVHDALGWGGYAEVGSKQKWGDIFAKAYGKPGEFGVAAGVTW